MFIWGRSGDNIINEDIGVVPNPTAYRRKFEALLDKARTPSYNILMSSEYYSSLIKD